jgi:hypothetical protein
MGTIYYINLYGEMSNMNEIEKDLNSFIVNLKDSKLISTKNISDKWHTFGDLYHHRMAFNIALCNAINIMDNELHNLEGDTYCYKSWKHYDNEKDPMFEDSFIVVIESPFGQISYHYNSKYWDKFNIPEKEKANEYDGHTPDDTAERLMLLFSKIYEG